MKILIVPDVHGRTFWRKALESDYDKVVFLGDYLDPYSYEGITPVEAISEFKDIIQFKKDNPDKVVLLLGNHDCSYFYNLGSASRYDYLNANKIKSIFKENEDCFELWYRIDKYLFTHAGITNDWLSTYFNLDINNFLSLDKSDIIPKLWVYSRMRGGYGNTGSMVWSDVREGDKENTYYQIFGHTQLESKPIITDTYACLDCRKCFTLNTKTSEIL